MKGDWEIKFFKLSQKWLLNSTVLETHSLEKQIAFDLDLEHPFYLEALP